MGPLKRQKPGFRQSLIDSDSGIRQELGELNSLVNQTLSADVKISTPSPFKTPQIDTEFFS